MTDISITAFRTIAQDASENGETVKELTWVQLQNDALSNMKEEDVMALNDEGMYTFCAKPGSLVYMPPHYACRLGARADRSVWIPLRVLVQVATGGLGRHG